MIGDTLQRKLQPLKDAEDLVFQRRVVSGALLSGAGVLVVMIWLAMAKQWFSVGMIFALLLLAVLLVVASVFWQKR